MVHLQHNSSHRMHRRETERIQDAGSLPPLPSMGVSARSSVCMHACCCCFRSRCSHYVNPSLSLRIYTVLVNPRTVTRTHDTAHASRYHAQCDVERRSCTKYGLMPGSPLRGLGSVEVDPFVEVA